jgi:hypothetical protein
MTVNIYDMAQTWNDGATTFAGIKLNVTDTASASGSLLMDLQVGGTSFYKFGKGQYTGSHGLIIGDGTVGGGASFKYIQLDTAWGDVDFTAWGGRLIATGGGLSETIFNSSLAATPTHFIGIEAANGAINAALYSDAVNRFDQRNSTNAQAFNIYNTYTDASNYERGFMKWNSNVLQIGTEAAGTGTSRALKLSSSSVSGITIDANGNGIYFGGPLIPNGTRDVGHLSAPFRNIIFSPGSSITPTLNGTVTIEATNNTTLTFKLKGSDGTVRSGTVTLS